MKVNGKLSFDASAASVIENLRLERGAALPTFGVSDTGRLFYNTTSNVIYYGGASAWTVVATGGNAAALQTEVNNILATLGTLVNSADGTTNVAAALTSPLFGGATNLTTALVSLASAVSINDHLAQLADVALTTLSNGQYLKYNFATSKWVNETFVLADVTNVTTSFTELNQLAGAGAVTSDFTKLHAITASAADLNVSLGLAATSVTATELGYVHLVTSPIQAQLNGKQALNSGLTNLSALADGAGLGIVVQTGVDTFVDRQLVAPAKGITISNPKGTAGDFTFALSNGTAALENLTTTGFAVRTGVDTWYTTALVSGNIGRIVVTNGDGVAAAPTIDLATVTQAASGSFQKFTVDGYGRVVATTAVVATDITTFTDPVYVKKAGDTLTGNLSFTNSATITGIPTPVNPTDVAPKSYVDSAVAGLTWKSAVRAATTGTNIVLSGVQTIDGVVLVAGDRVLVKDQTALSDNGIYVVAAAAWTRSTDLNLASEFAGSAVLVKSGTTLQDTGWTEVNTVVTLGTDPVKYSQFTGSSVITAGTGLFQTGNVISVAFGAGIVELPAGQTGIDLRSFATSALILTDDGITRATTASSQLMLLLKSAGGLTQDAGGLYIPALGVTNAMLFNSSIVIDADGASAGTVALGGTLNVFGNATAGIVTSVTGSTVTVTASDATATQKGVAKFDVSSFAVAAGNVTIKAAGISNAQLANSTISYAGDTGGNQTVALGSSFSIFGTAAQGVSTLSAAGSVTITMANATASQKGVASFNGAQFSVVAGAVSIATTLGQGAITNVSSTVNTAASGDVLSYNTTTSKWENVTRAAVVGSTSVGAHNDVVLTSPAAGQTLIENAAGKFVNRSIYFQYSTATAQTTHTVLHSLGQKYCNVTVVDGTDEVVIPQSIHFTDANTLTVTFNTAIACTVVVMGVNAS